ncbi:MAG: EAL domain-containing protein [Ancalomicrobiaceae bacterium]|nr:EAL domain-containing protein [Ancalomicrobiaceae bacterium]
MQFLGRRTAVRRWGAIWASDIRRDIAICLTVAVAISSISWRFEIFENLISFAEKHDDIFIDDLIFAVLCMSLALTVFAVRRMRAQQREIVRRIAAEEQALRLTLGDPLTGLPNRRAFVEMLAAVYGRNERQAVLMMDLKNFKTVNDVFGRPEGDALLQRISALLSEAVGTAGFLARLGGDEFAVVIERDASIDRATLIATRIVEQMRRQIVVNRPAHHIGIGIGIALSSDGATGAEDLVRRADVALCRAKSSGYWAYTFYEATMDADLLERSELERCLRLAIDMEAIQPHYQPIVDLTTAAIVGYEALARWTHPTLGAVPPSRFIPLAEELGLMRELTDQLLRRACADACNWPERVYLSFNISPIQLRDRGLGLSVMAALADAGLPPRRLELEITEGALVQDFALARKVLSELRLCGIRVALDDFGTGYSSLQHLQELQIDRIKIDRSFVAKIADDERIAVIVAAILQLATGLDLAVTAEGVETPDEAERLVALGCRFGQGYLFGKAMPPNRARPVAPTAPVRHRA